MGAGKPLDEDFDFRAGQIVVSKRGKDAGHRYVIVGFLGGNRLALADAVKFNTDRPKLKNPKHVTRLPYVMGRAAECAEAGKNVNRGELCHFLESIYEICDRQSNGEAG